MSKTIIIVGSGPAGLMAASVLSENFDVLMLEKTQGPGRKLLIAGSSGLNISFNSPWSQFSTFYREGAERLKPILERFDRQEWFQFLEDLGIEVFLGTSNKYFVKGMVGAPLLKNWTTRLRENG